MKLISTKAFIDKTLKALNPINRYGVQVLAIKRIVQDQLNMIPTREYVLKDGGLSGNPAVSYF